MRRWAALVRMRPSSRLLSHTIERADGRAEVLAYVRGDERAHAARARREVARAAAEIDGGHDGLESIRRVFERAIALRKTAGDEAGQRVARAGRAEAGVAGRVDDDAPVRATDDRPCAFQNDDQLLRGC